jgi:two-component system, OmpR family, alkaline phosphatase synthesis response regulator PhoP
VLKIYKVIYRNERGTVMHILIAEDHPDLRKILTLYLQKEGYQVSVVSNGQEAITYLMERCGLKKEAKNNLGLTFSKSPSSHAPATLPDLLILDWMMPVQDGIQTCREIRALNLPIKILMLTAKGETEHEILGLTSGADDYVRKPFDIKVLLLRIKKLCRLEGILCCGDISLNQETFEVRKGNTRLALTKTEYEMLRYFLSNQRITLTREQLLNHAWGMDFEGDSRTVDTHIRRLRRKIGEEYIKTRIGIGYVISDRKD